MNKSQITTVGKRSVPKPPLRGVVKDSKPEPDTIFNSAKGSVPPERPLFSSANPGERMVEVVEEMFELEKGIEDLVAEGIQRPVVAKKKSPQGMRGSVPPEQSVFNANDPRQALIDSIEPTELSSDIEDLVAEGTSTSIEDWKRIPKAPKLPMEFRS
ncbi:hypothetical protein KKE92_05045 [Candidatus Micrarchaeota archaeon]|nr:hypothetical protein [Candidatus Micrarchaeota archaeon]MBU1681554.1 hypothetical protein [Candidatus Micrarchaeota archaeon]